MVWVLGAPILVLLLRAMVLQRVLAEFAQKFVSQLGQSLPHSLVNKQVTLQSTQLWEFRVADSAVQSA